MDLGRYSKILKNKKIMLFLLIYLVFLSVTVYLFKLGSPPKGEVDVYKGVIHGDKTGFFGLTILFSAPSIKEAGANLMVNECPFFVDSEGNIREFPYFRQFLIHNIQTAHRNGLKYCMELQEAYLSGEPGSPARMTFAVPEKVWPTFFPQWNRLVLEYAELAEKYGVEMFAPWVEGDGALGAEKGSEWGQEILPQIRERYSGEILWRAGFTAGGVDGLWVGAGGFAEIMEDHPFARIGAFTGYDYIGFTIVPSMVVNWEYGNPESEANYRIWLREVIDYALMCAERDGCKGVIATEFGEDRVFEEGAGKLSGYFFWFEGPIFYWYGEGPL